VSLKDQGARSLNNLGKGKGKCEQNFKGKKKKKDQSKQLKGGKKKGGGGGQIRNTKKKWGTPPLEGRTNSMGEGGGGGGVSLKIKERGAEWSEKGEKKPKSFGEERERKKRPFKAHFP